MPVIHSGTFTLKGGTATSVAGGWFFGPDGSGGYKYYCTLLGPGVPTDYVATEPALLDTSADGTNIPAASPPPGFTPSTNLGINPHLQGVGGADPSLGTIEYGTLSGGLLTFSGAFPDYTLYSFLFNFLRIRITYHGTTDSPQEVTNSTYTRADFTVGGNYDIIYFWWKLPEKDACGNRQTPRYALAAEAPSPEYERLDPDDPDAFPQPIIQALEPNHGIEAGGTALTIRGSGFGEGADVQIDGVSASDIVVVSSSEIQCTTPPHVAGYASVVVINADGVTS